MCPVQGFLPVPAGQAVVHPEGGTNGSGGSSSSDPHPCTPSFGGHSDGRHTYKPSYLFIYIFI